MTYDFRCSVNKALNLTQRMFNLYPGIFPNYIRLGKKKKKKKALRNLVTTMNFNWKLKLPCWTLNKEMLTSLSFFIARKSFTKNIMNYTKFVFYSNTTFQLFLSFLPVRAPMIAL